MNLPKLLFCRPQRDSSISAASENRTIPARLLAARESPYYNLRNGADFKITIFDKQTPQSEPLSSLVSFAAASGIQPSGRAVKRESPSFRRESQRTRNLAPSEDIHDMNVNSVKRILCRRTLFEKAPYLGISRREGQPHHRSCVCALPGPFDLARSCVP